MERCLSQDEIRRLEDKNLQLRYLLGGLNTQENIVCESNIFWLCDIRCKCYPVPEDERLTRVKDFINNHNISNETFMRYVLSYTKGYLLRYKGKYGELIEELDRVLMNYKFIHSTCGKGRILENELKEKELLELLDIYSEEKGSLINNFLSTYSLTKTDFMVLAKTRLNRRFQVLRGFKIKDLPADLYNILEKFDLFQSEEFIKEYHRQIEERRKQEDLKSRIEQEYIEYRRTIEKAKEDLEQMRTEIKEHLGNTRQLRTPTFLEWFLQ